MNQDLEPGCGGVVGEIDHRMSSAVPSATVDFTRIAVECCVGVLRMGNPVGFQVKIP